MLEMEKNMEDLENLVLKPIYIALRITSLIKEN